MDAVLKTFESLRTSTGQVDRLSERLALLAPDRTRAEELRARARPDHDVVVVGDTSPWRALATVDVTDGSPTLSLVGGEALTQDVVTSLLAG